MGSWGQVATLHTSVNAHPQDTHRAGREQHSSAQNTGVSGSSFQEGLIKCFHQVPRQGHFICPEPSQDSSPGCWKGTRDQGPGFLVSGKS